MSELIADTVIVGEGGRQSVEPAPDRPSLAPIVAALADEATIEAARRERPIDYSVESIKTVDRLLEEMRSDRRHGSNHKARRLRLAFIWGAYVGEVIRRRRGGSWKYGEPSTNDPLSFTLDVHGLTIRPVEKVYKCLASGARAGLELCVAAIVQRPERT